MPGTLPNLNNRSSNHNPVHHSHACYVTRSFNEYHRGCYFEAPTWNCIKFVPQDLEHPSKERGYAIKYTFVMSGPGSKKMTRISENPGKDIRLVLSKKLYSIVFSCFCHTDSRFFRQTMIFFNLPIIRAKIFFNLPSSYNVILPLEASIRVVTQRFFAWRP